MRVAALDLGSNTFLCLIVEVAAGVGENPVIEKILSDEVRMVRLGQGVSQTRQFHPEALARAEAALKDFSQTIQHWKPDVVLAMATSAARDVTNSQALFDLGQKYQIPIEIIPGDLEAHITFSGAVSGLRQSEKQILVVDIGGGSTEYISGKGSQLNWGHSLNMGCVRLKEMLSGEPPFSADRILAARGEIQKQLKSLPEILRTKNQGQGVSLQVDEILAVAGTPTELARIEIGRFEPSLIDGFCFDSALLGKWIQRLTPLTAQQIVDQFGVSPGRADVLLIGVLILAETLSYFNKAQLLVSTRGVRYGVALEGYRRHAKLGDMS